MVAFTKASGLTAAPAATGALVDLAQACLRRNSYLTLKNLSCEQQGGALVLRGCLPSYYLKQVAQEVVARLDGVIRIDNRIEVLCCVRQMDG
jgi:hypothetical protein